MLQTKIQSVCIVGLGYVGLPTAATFAARGFDVVGVDINREAVDRINSGRAHIVEPDLDMVLGAAVKSGKLLYRRGADADHPRSQSRYLRGGSGAQIDCRGAQAPRSDRHRVDVAGGDHRTRRSAATQVAAGIHLPGYASRAIRHSYRLLPGANPAGPHTARAHRQCACPRRPRPAERHTREELYASFAVGPMRLTTARVAELSKLVENAFRDVNVAFANELSLVCDTLGIDVWSVIKIANLHPRVNILSPGPGVGGHCIPIDPWFIHQAAPDRTPLIRAAREVNDGKPHFVADRIIKLAKRFRQPVIGLLGLSYKPNVDDLRESPALEIARKIASRRIGTVLAVEPHLTELPEELANYPGVQLTDLTTAVKRADIIGILVGHNKFRSLDRGAVASKIVVDTVGLLAGLDDPVEHAA